jgi:hypothetical protein
MSLLVANMTGAAPLWVPASSVVDLGQGLRGVRGISSAGSHHKVRRAAMPCHAMPCSAAARGRCCATVLHGTIEKSMPCQRLVLA